MSPRLWAVSGLDGPALIAELVSLAPDRHNLGARWPSGRVGLRDSADERGAQEAEEFAAA